MFNVYKVYEGLNETRYGFVTGYLSWSEAKMWENKGGYVFHEMGSEMDIHCKTWEI